MSRVGVVAFGAVSGLGRGAAAVDAGAVGERARVVIAADAELAGAGLARPFASRCASHGDAPGEGRAGALLSGAIVDCAADLDLVRPAWRRERVGLVLGTSSGGMREATRLFEGLHGGWTGDREAPTYFGPAAAASRALGVAFDPATVVLAACASSTLAIGLACRWLERGACDVALAGGFDDVTVFVASGFEALRAICAAPPPRPFRLGRDGMALGEGAAVLALARDDETRRSGRRVVYVSGFGAACDGFHITAPARDGGGLARAATAAVAEARPARVDLVSAHGTATPFNDAAEWRAIVASLGESAAREAPVHPFKAQIGHTLGAAGALESLACIDAIARGVLPAAAGEGPLDADAPARLLERSRAGAPTAALKLSAAFGGANAALVLSVTPGEHPSYRAAYLHHASYVDREPPLDDLAVAAHTTEDRLGRADRLVRLTLAAVARLEGAEGSLAGAGIVLGSPYATLETNAAFALRMRERGARFVEPRRFPYTSPNAAPGECAIAFGLTGPNLSVGGGLHAALEAFAVAALIVEAGDAERMVVVAADDAGEATRALGGDAVTTGAVAALISRDVRDARARVGDTTLRRGHPVTRVGPAGHAALLPLVGGSPPRTLESASPPDAFARIVLDPL